MKILCQYSKLKKLLPTKGDHINEINFMRALSSFANVKFAANELNDNIDILYTRYAYTMHNRQEAKIKIMMASPYSDYFKRSDYVATFTESWAEALRNGEKIPGLNPLGEKIKNAINIGQTLADHFKPTEGIKFEGYPIIGCFGRMVKSNYPHLLFASWNKILKKYPKARLILGITGTNFKVPHEIVNYQYKDMPKVISACDIISVNQVGVEWDFCGSNKVLESCACGTPVLIAKSRARQEHLGNYKYFFNESFFRPPITEGKINKFIEYIEAILNDKNVSQYVIERTKKHSMSEQSKYLQTLFNTFSI